MSSRFRYSGYLLAVACCLSSLHVLGQAFSEDRLKRSCETLLRSPLDNSGLQVLLDTSRAGTNSPALRSRAMAAYSLSLLMRGNTNAFEQGARIQRTTYPQDKDLITVTRDAYLATCGDCLGSGTKTTLCPSCMGSGKCKACEGAGIRKPVQGEAQPCQACKRTGSCPMCSGKQKIVTPCPACNGAGRIYKLSSHVGANYQGLLSNIVALCAEDLAFAGQYQEAVRENDNDARIQKLQALIAGFPGRTDLANVRPLLESAQKTRDERMAAQRKRDENEKAERDLADLRKLAESSDTAQSIAKLKAYLAGHPTSASQFELEGLLDELTARQERRQLITRIVFGLLALAGAMLFVQLIRPLLFRRRRSGATAVAEIDKSRFTDPLTLTAKESKARVKTKTANIELPK